MNMIRYQPWGLVHRLHHDLDRMLDRQWRDEDETTSPVSDWLPAVDIEEEDRQFVLRADIPGVDPKDIEVTMDKGVLTLRGVRHVDGETHDQAYRRVERASGGFFRRFSLPDTADSDRITAKSRLGVLEVIIPKHAEIQPKKIDIQVD
ncbi:MAG: Hsp20/alpha crystallin family protein [Gammaproteobacteria bacterium]|nr:Hsp20/alpha crystallin family protein [Pseudomonadota bacterium]MCZ6536832.1 Hsp20/alpha crystallin family protein [Gammaproteobacteria bacterium]MCZ6687633.1 Hsp20/alpha crystallin family protein [Gammaproteobacteria bacterium]MCZ6762556.1 Hsp20/alpha crystallin family protein [Gammaproteobacteria bacterium]MCZ6880387.1 Hsp20/alpha crystallin family protein [Gammaproteobacteria bacterium]